ncbi:MAG TPA: GNAT family N-acetyltransferase [Jatrophihabitans sp.]|nr:GNAT family N-acetyltransferase [Jatrophihabitans sp.]
MAGFVGSVRPCRAVDLPALDAAFPLGDVHRHRIDGQIADRWLYLIAFAPGPVGHCLVHWHGPTILSVRDVLPHCVEINHLYVAEHARGRGSGSALLAEAESSAVVRRRTTIGLGVGDDNPSARRLYTSLGYAPSGARYAVDYEYPDAAGRLVPAHEAGDFLVKSLPATA